MTHLINKSALVAEIEKRKEKCDTFYNIALSNNAEFAKVAIEEQKRQYNSLLSFLDTLEVKEVDLDESARHYLLHEHVSSLNEVLHQADLKVEMQYHKDIEGAYKAGFELGLKTQKGE